MTASSEVIRPSAFSRERILAASVRACRPQRSSRATRCPTSWLADIPSQADAAAGWNLKPTTVVLSSSTSVWGQRSGPAMRNSPSIHCRSIVPSGQTRRGLARDAEIEQSDRSPTEFSLGHVVASEAEVNAVMHQATAAGARIVKKAQKTFWGGYAGYFADPDGHLWEIAHNPGLLPLE